MTDTREREQRRARARRAGLRSLIAIPLILSQMGGSAWAYWTASSDPGGSGASAATSVDQGATPTASATGAAVTVSWSATTLTSGQAVSGYVIKRYDTVTPFALPTILPSCTGTIAATSCVENSVPTGSWQYTVTPTYATNWLGAESLKSTSVLVDGTAPANGITVSNVTGGAHQISDNIFYRGAAAGSFTLTNALADADSGPASSTTASLTGTTTGWTHTPSPVSTPSGGPYVSNAFSWSSSTTTAPGEDVTGRDAEGNTATTSLSFVDDSTTPGAGTISYSDGIQSGSSVSVTFTTGTDAGSGIGTRLLQRASANLTGTTCGSFGTFSTITGGTNPTSPLVDSVSKGCFQYRYVVSDNVGNQDTATSANVAKVEASYSSAVTGTTGLVGYWRLGESSGAQIADSFGTNPGTYVNAPTLGATGAISGNADTAATFNGPNQYGTVARQISDNFSIEFWFKSTQSAGSGCSQWYHGNGLVDAEVGGVTNDFGVSLCAGRVVAGVGGTFDSSIVSAAGYNNGAWHHVVFTRTRSSGALSLYLDGVLAGSATGSTASLTTPANIAFGRLQTAIQYFAGTLDEIAVYNTALSQATVTNHYGWDTGLLPPVVTATGAALAYTENATPQLDSGVTATDGDSANLTSATVTMTTNYVNGQDTLAFTDQFGITGTWTPGTGVLALTGNATVAHYQSALRSITYNNSSDDPTTTRTVTFVANDGTSGGSTASRTITLTAVNDAPVNSVPGSQATDSNSAVVFSTGNGNLISVSDADAGAGMVEVQLVSTLGRSTLSGTTGLSFSVGDGTADTTMTFTGTTTDANTALAGLSFTPTSVGAGSLQIATSDQGNTGTGGTLSDNDTIAIALGDLGLFTNTADIGSGAAGPTSSSYQAGVYTEVGNGTQIWGGSDQFHYRYKSWTGDGTIIARVTALGNSQISAQAAVMFRETTGIGSTHALMSVRPTAANSAEWMHRSTTGGSTAVVDTAGLTPTLWLKLVRSGNAFTGFTAPDSGGAAGTWTQRGTQSITMGNTILVGLSTLSHSATLTTTATFDNVSLSAPPALTASGSSRAYTENTTTVVDSGITASDGYSPLLTSATVTMTTNYVNGQDTLAFTDQFGITGTWTPGTGVLSLTGSATVAHYQSALRSITYTNNSDNPGTATRTVTFTSNDGVLDSNTASRTITLTALNDAPVNSIPGSQATDSNTAVVFSTGNGNLISISDADTETALVEVQLVSTLGTSTLSGTTGLSFSVGDGTADPTMTFTSTTTDANTALAGLSFTPASIGASSLQIVTSDQGNTGAGGTLTDNDTIAITVESPYAFTIGATAGLFSYWRLGEDSSGDAIDDIAIQDNDGNYFNYLDVGMSGAIAGDPDTAVAFYDWAQSYGSVTRQISDDFSIEFWFSSWQNYYSDPACQHWWQGAGLVDSNSSSDPANDFGVSLCNGRVLAGSGNPDTSIVSTGTYNDGSWHHVVFTRTRSTGEMQLYVDGADAGSAAGSTESLTEAASIYFGALANDTGYFDGYLDEVAIYDTALSGATVTDHYNAAQ